MEHPKDSEFVNGDVRMFVQGFAVLEKTNQVVAIVSNRSAGKDGKSEVADESKLLDSISHLEKGEGSGPKDRTDMRGWYKDLADRGLNKISGMDNLMTLRASLETVHSIEADPVRKSGLQRLKNENDVNQFVTLDGRKLGDLPEGNQPHDRSRVGNDGLVYNTLPVMPPKPF